MPPRLHLPALFFLTTAAGALAAQGLPASSPTAPVPTAPPPVRQTPTSQPPRRALVSFTAGQLTVKADNSSLNQIIRDIARLTGMKITGGVIEERVFGGYGPGETGTVLSALLDGTGSNMLLISNAQQAPQELVLTPRQGGPTPPNPNATRERDEQADLPPQLNPPFPAGDANTAPQQQSPPVNPFNRPRPNLSGVPSDPSTTNATTAPAATDTTTTEQSPNGVKTPEQIYQQLLKLQQQQPKTPQ